MACSRVNFTFTLPFNNTWWCCWFCSCQQFTNVVLITPHPNTFSICFSCSAKDQVSPACKTAGKVMFLYTFNQYVFEWQTEDKKFSLAWFQVYSDFNRHLISAWVWFRFVSVLTANYAFHHFLYCTVYPIDFCFMLICVLTPWCRVLLEKLTGLQLVKKFPAFHGTRKFITALTSVRL